MAGSIGIVGGGALGALFAHALASVAEVVLLVRRPAAATEIEREGIRVAGYEERRVSVALEPTALAGVGVLILAVKTYDTVAALRPLRGVLSPGVPVVSVQNGLDGELRIAAALGDAQTVVLAPTSEAATPLGSGSIARVGIGLTRLGQATLHAPAALADLAALLHSAGLAVEIANPIEPHVWAKAIANAAINPVGALFDLDNASVAQDARARALAAELTGEAVAVARASGVRLPFDDPLEHAFAVARATGANRSSMWHDLRTGRPTEIDALNGAIAVRGARLGIPTPANLRIADEVKRRSAAYGSEHA